MSNNTMKIKPTAHEIKANHSQESLRFLYSYLETNVEDIIGLLNDFELDNDHEVQTALYKLIMPVYDALTDESKERLKGGETFTRDNDDIPI
jgi:hypothetical protein